MKHLYESDKIEIISRIESLLATIEGRLLPTFDAIENEAKNVEEEELARLSRNFDPDRMDEAEVYERAFHAGVEHYSVHSDMKREFLKSSAVWLFHLFEKDCTYIFNTEDGNEKKRVLSQLCLDISDSSDWFKCNRELRLLANAIKHGAGNSLDKLKEVRPDLFSEKFSMFSDDKVELSSGDISGYGDSMKKFWMSFFDAAL
ncbi:hypothetical protein [Vreelandella zhanjiangensis]|uniref:hypothetical protein n=1 Tax=Vreelandella zhanjiangensis TaxID=1121960 RepID=UPI00036AC6EA|nr:hypothetical protein [Halomonas zhanjiangensis]